MHITHDQSLHQRFIKILGPNISKVDYKFRTDLSRLFNLVGSVFLKMDRELVNCRRLKKYTLKYKELEAELDSNMRRYEKYYLQAILSSKTL